MRTVDNYLGKTHIMLVYVCSLIALVGVEVSRDADGNALYGGIGVFFLLLLHMVLIAKIRYFWSWIAVNDDSPICYMTC